MTTVKHPAMPSQCCHLFSAELSPRECYPTLGGGEGMGERREEGGGGREEGGGGREEGGGEIKNKDEGRETLRLRRRGDEKTWR